MTTSLFHLPRVLRGLLFIAVGWCLWLPAATAQTAPPKTTIPSTSNRDARPADYASCEARVAAIKGKPCDIIFIGDSITQNFQDEPPSGWDLTGGAVWKKHYGNRHALDFGVNADRTENVLWRLDHMEIRGLSPKVAVILIGTNDTDSSSPADIAAGVKAVVEKTQKRFDGVKIILMSILPTSRETQKVVDTNKIISTFGDDKSVYYFDLAAKMTPEGNSWKGVGHDNLHIKPEGYELWAHEMEPLLTQLLDAPPNL